MCEYLTVFEIVYVVGVSYNNLLHELLNPSIKLCISVSNFRMGYEYKVSCDGNIIIFYCYLLVGLTFLLKLILLLEIELYLISKLGSDCLLMFINSLYLQLLMHIMIMYNNICGTKYIATKCWSFY